MAKNKLSSKRTYRFCGNGEGVAGLPHEISEQEARERGVLELLQAAVKLGTYHEIQPAIELEVEEGE